jgi:hypothetical protein
VPDELGDVRHQALHLEFGHHLLENAAVLFTLGRTLEFQRHGDRHLFVEADAGEVHVDDLDAEVIPLNVLHQHLLALAVEADVEQVRAALDVTRDLLLRELHRNHGLLVAVHHARHETGVAKTLVRTRAKLLALNRRQLCRLNRHVCSSGRLAIGSMARFVYSFAFFSRSR